MTDPSCSCDRERALREQWQATHEQLHLRDREALALAREAEQRQFHSLNELRKEVISDRMVLVSETVNKELYDREHGRIIEELRLLRQGQDRLSGERAGLTLGWQILVGAIGLISTFALILNAVRLFRLGM